MTSKLQRLIVAISGASGVIYGIRLLETLRQASAVETHLVLTESSKITITQETEWRISDVEALADVIHKANNIGASIASGSFVTMGMVVAPCSIKSLSNIAHSNASDLLARAADVQLKEGRPLLLVVRETPLHLGHLRLMVQAAEIGATIIPPVPGFYGRPQTVDDIVNDTVGRILLRLGIDNDLYFEWLGLKGKS
ncbi:MAG TPA: UbiX family flavin prenyltransferase [Aggregatilineaceae bacterium]|nr:UbiX family flavin prenyltransferase [Aggregatilineaceae bacterium]